MLQRRKDTSLLELLESHTRESTPKVAIKPWSLIPLPTRTSPSEQPEKERKREKKSKEMSKDGEIAPKDLKPRREQRLLKEHREKLGQRAQAWRWSLSAILGF